MGASGSAVDHLDVAVVGSGDGIHHPIPDASFSPWHEAVVAGGARTVALRQVAHWRARSQHPEYPVQHTSFIDAWNASRLIGQQRFDHAPLKVGQIISAHADAESEFRLRVKSVVWSMHAQRSACRHSFALHVRPAVAGAARRSMLHLPAVRFFLTNELRSAIESVRGCFVEGHSHAAVTQQCKGATTSLVVAATGHIQNVEVRRLGVFLTCIVPKRCQPVTVANHGVELQIVPNRSAKLTG